MSQDDKLIFTSLYPNKLAFKMEILCSQFDPDKNNIHLDLTVVNQGDTIWYCIHSDPEAGSYGTVNIGIQRFSSDGQCLDQDFHRVPLPSPLHPDRGILTPVDIPYKPEYQGQKLKLDLVIEGITWFSNLGHPPVWYKIPLAATHSN